MSDVRNLIDRCFRTYLEPPSARAAFARLSGAITDAGTSLVIGSWVVPEDEEMMRAGVALELDSELVDVLSYDEFTSTCVVERGVEGTTATAHADGAKVKLSPKFARQSVFEAVADNIIGLFPDLYTTESALLVSAGGVAPLDDALAVSIIDIWTGANGTGGSIEGRIVDYHPQVGGRALILDSAAGQVWVRYRRRFASVTSEDDTFTDIGLDPRWANIVVIGACADLMAGADLEASHVDWVTQSLAAETVPVGTRAQLATAMARYRELLVDRAKSEMRSEYKARVRMRPSVVFR